MQPPVAALVAVALLLAARRPLARADPDWPCVQRLVPRLAARRSGRARCRRATGAASRRSRRWSRASRRGRCRGGGSPPSRLRRAVGRRSRRRLLPLAFAGVLEETNRQRDVLIEQLRRFARRQRDLAEQVRGLEAELRAARRPRPGGARGAGATPLLRRQVLHRCRADAALCLRGAGAAGRPARRLCAGDAARCRRLNSAASRGARDRVQHPRSAVRPLPSRRCRRCTRAPGGSPRRRRASRHSSSSSNRRGSRTRRGGRGRRGRARQAVAEPRLGLRRERAAPDIGQPDAAGDAEARARPPQRARRQAFRPARRGQHVDPDHRRGGRSSARASAVSIIAPAGHGQPASARGSPPCR